MNDRLFGGNNPFGRNGMESDDEDFNIEKALASLMMLKSLMDGGMPGMEEMMGSPSMSSGIPGVGRIQMQGVDPETAAKIEAAIKEVLGKDKPIDTDDPRLFKTKARLTGEQNVVKALESYVDQLVAEKKALEELMKDKEAENSRILSSYGSRLDKLQEDLYEARGRARAACSEKSLAEHRLVNAQQTVTVREARLQKIENDYSVLNSKFAGAQLTISDIKEVVEGLSKKPQIKDYKAVLVSILESIQAHEDANAPTPVENTDDSAAQANETQENSAVA